jgi:hypothetical protein
MSFKTYEMVLYRGNAYRILRTIRDSIHCVETYVIYNALYGYVLVEAHELQECPESRRVLELIGNPDKFNRRW